MPAGIRNANVGFGCSAGTSGFASTSEKIRLGFIVGKGHDPIPVGTQDRAWPEALKLKNNTGPKASGWGGQFGIDVAIGLKVGRLHPDVFEIDFISGEEISPSRLQRNHLNFNLAYDFVNAFLTGDKVHQNKVKRAFEGRSSRLWPEWDLQDWVYNKASYMKSCIKAGIPVIDTIFVSGQLDPTRVLKQVQAKGWDKFFIKPASNCSFGMGGWHGNTQDCIDDPAILQKYAKEDGDGFVDFLVQPYMLKPDGNVFDEVRVFFVDGEFAFAVYTDGTDDNKVWTQPDDAVLKQCKEIAARAYRLFLSKAVWRGKSFVPPITRFDIGFMPVSKGSSKLKLFLNEIEMEAATLLPRYCPFNLVNRLGDVYVNSIRKLLRGQFAAGDKVPNAKKVQEHLAVLDERLAEKARTSEAPAEKRSVALVGTPAKKRSLGSSAAQTPEPPAKMARVRGGA